MGVKLAAASGGSIELVPTNTASALIPVMWAEIQSLRKRLAAAGI